MRARVTPSMVFTVESGASVLLQLLAISMRTRFSSGENTSVSVILRFAVGTVLGSPMFARTLFSS